MPRAFMRMMRGIWPEAVGTLTMSWLSFFFSIRVSARYPSLGEHLGDLDLAAVSLVELDEHPVRGEVFERDQGPLRPADDEISARVDWVFLSVFDQLAAVLVERELPLILHVFLVEEAALRFHHDREVPDVDALRFPLDPVFDDGEIEVDRRGV